MQGETESGSQSMIRLTGSAVVTWIENSAFLLLFVLILGGAILIPFFTMVWVDHQLVRPAIGYHPWLSLLMMISGPCIGGGALWSLAEWAEEDNSDD